MRRHPFGPCMGGYHYSCNILDIGTNHNTNASTKPSDNKCLYNIFINYRRFINKQFGISLYIIINHIVLSHGQIDNVQIACYFWRIFSDVFDIN